VHVLEESSLFYSGMEGVNILSYYSISTS